MTNLSRYNCLIMFSQTTLPQMVSHESHSLMALWFWLMRKTLLNPSFLSTVWSKRKVFFRRLMSQIRLSQASRSLMASSTKYNRNPNKTIKNLKKLTIYRTKISNLLASQVTQLISPLSKMFRTQIGQVFITQMPSQLNWHCHLTFVSERIWSC